MSGLLLISASPRKGNGDAIAEAVRSQLSRSGRRVRIVRLADWSVRPCNACGFCTSHPGQCALDNIKGEQGRKVLELVAQAAALLIVSPIWFYGPPAQLKALVDRSQCYWEAARTNSTPVKGSSAACVSRTPPPVRPAWNIYTAARKEGQRLFEASGLILRCFVRQMGFVPQQDLHLRELDAPDAFLSSPEACAHLSTFCDGLTW